MTRMLRRFLLPALWLACAALFAAGRCAAAADDTYAELLHKSGLWVQIASVETQFEHGLDAAHAEHPGLTPRQLEALHRAAAGAYAADRLRQDVLRRLRALLSAQDAAGALTWFDSPLGARLTALESGASTRDPGESQPRSAAAYAGLPDGRKALLQQLLTSAGASDLFASVALNQIAGVARGIATATGRPVPDAATIEQRTRLLRAQIKGAIEPLLLAQEALVYASVSDEDLAKYVEFVGAGAGKAVVAAMSQALERALAAAAVDFGQRLAHEAAEAERTQPI